MYINTLPYPNESRLKEEKTDESYADKIKRWIARGQAGYEGGMPEIMLSHLFVAGGSVSDGERDIDLGGARVVELDWLPDCDYIALGHLHKKQHFTKKNVWYSGSVLQYSFDESGTKKCVILLETDSKKLLSTKEIPLTKGKKLLRLRAESVEEGVLLLEQNPDCHVELTLKLKAPMSATESKQLLAHKCLKSLIPMIETEKTAFASVSRKGMTTAELFDAYYRSVYEGAPDKEIKTLFLELAEEALT
ncbi:MAG: hypothetical protein J6Z36_00790 [Clostridia bacterium]|nr:hypothetical protein [Clostridia bacterium]